MSNQQVGKLTNPTATSTIPLIRSSYGFDSAPILGLGVGYYFNDWMRFDLTGEYRGRANFHGSEIYSIGGGYATDEYSGSKSEWLVLANAYADLGTWHNFTPFVGVGFGFARVGLFNFQDACHGCGGNPANNGISFADDGSKWNFAWALHAGVSYKISRNFAVELSYRYLDMGKATTGSIVSYDFAQTLPGSTFDRLTSHDIRLGLRMNFDAFSSSAVYAQPQPASYSVYAQAPASALRAAPGQQSSAPTYAQPVSAASPSTHYAAHR
jgi:opacity protein-like surface antigen